MHSDRDSIVEAFDALDAAVSAVCGLSFDVLTTPERLRALERLERVARRLPVPGHVLITGLLEQASEEELGGKLRAVLADRLRITSAEAGRRIGEAEELGARRAMSGEPLAPQLAATAAAQRDGLIGQGHLKVIRGFFTQVPAEVDVLTRAAAEADLAGKASRYRPDELAKYANKLMDCLNPDGNFTDEDRARRRGLLLGEQGYDGMSRLSGYVNPELRATIEAVLATLAAPGMANPEDDVPVIDGAPSEDTARRDLRSQPQRNHDGLLAGLRALLASGQLGQHHGLPTTLIVTTTLKELQAAAGRGLSAGGTVVPMSDLLRLAGHAHHYLAVFEGAKPLALYHTKRLATPAQRIMLLAKDRGCSKPGCDVPGYWTQVHHVQGWARTRRTHINELTLACAPHNRLADKGWTTRTNTKGDTEWIPPPHLDHGQPRTNTLHHPEKLLRQDEDDEP